MNSTARKKTYIGRKQVEEHNATKINAVHAELGA